MCTLSSGNRVRVIEAHGVELLARFMSKHPSNEAVQQEACLAINNLCINNGIYRDLLRGVDAYNT